jgi:ubiquinone/menaquinone biosynthesis C-methylase UbiE
MQNDRDLEAARVYEEYLGRAIADPFTRILLEFAKPKAGEKVLDLATGTGSVAREAAARVGSAGHVVALDINPSMIAVGRSIPRSAGAVIDWIEGDALDTRLPDGSFDLVCCQQGLQFFHDRSTALREMRRVLTPGGRAAISVWQTLTRHPIYEHLFDATARHLGVSASAFDVSFSLGSVEDLKRLLLAAEFQDLHVAPRSLDIALTSPEKFVLLTVRGAATSVPAFAKLSLQEQSSLVEAIKEELAPITSRYSQGDELSFPMHTHIATARR